MYATYQLNLLSFACNKAVNKDCIVLLTVYLSANYNGGELGLLPIYSLWQSDGSQWYTL